MTQSRSLRPEPAWRASLGRPVKPRDYGRPWGDAGSADPTDRRGELWHSWYSHQGCKDMEPLRGETRQRDQSRRLRVALDGSGRGGSRFSPTRGSRGKSPSRRRDDFTPPSSPSRVRATRRLSTALASQYQIGLARGAAPRAPRPRLRSRAVDRAQ